MCSQLFFLLLAFWKPELGVLEARLGVLEAGLGVLEAGLGVLEARLGVLEASCKIASDACSRGEKHFGRPAESLPMHAREAKNTSAVLQNRIRCMLERLGGRSKVLDAKSEPT